MSSDVQEGHAEHKEDQGQGACRLRCLIVDDSVSEKGVEGKLFAAAMVFVTEAGFLKCRLTTPGGAGRGEKVG